MKNKRNPAALFSILVFIATLTLSPRISRASTITVTNLNDSGSGSFRQAVLDAVSGDTINFSVTGTITFSSEIVINKSLTINANNFLDVVFSGDGATRLFNVSSGTQVSFNKIYFKRGLNTSSANGRAILNNGTLNINNSGLAVNSFANSGSQTDTTTGGAISNSASGILNVSDTQISFNNAAKGAGIYNLGTLSLTRATFEYNSGTGDGVIYNGIGATTNINSSSFQGNSAINGGVLYNEGAATIVNSTLYNNSSYSGGGIYVAQGSVTLNLSTVVGNRAHTNIGNPGGGIRVVGGTFNATGNVIAGNIAQSDPNISGVITSGGYNIVQARGSSTGYISSDFPDGTNPLMGGYVNNGGSTYTISPLNGSPAINAIPGTGGCASLGITVDQRGFARPSGAQCDSGSVEVDVTIPTPTSTATPTITPTPTSTNTPVPGAHIDTIGMYQNGVFYLRNSNTSGAADITFAFGGLASHRPIAGDWNGDGVDTVGVYDINTGLYQLRDTNSIGPADYAFYFGNPADTPIAGRWDNTINHDGVGVYRMSNGIVYLKRALTTGFDDYYMVFGNPSDRPVAGDWDGNGIDTLGIFRASDDRFFLSNTNGNGIVFSDLDLVLNGPGYYPVAGDWTGSGFTKVGNHDGSWTFFLRSTLTSGFADIVVSFGNNQTYPIAGHWIAGGGMPPLNQVVAGGSKGVPTFDPGGSGD